MAKRTMRRGEERRAYWTLHVKRWLRSGLASGEYCARAGIDRRVLYEWRRTLAAEDPDCPTPARRSGSGDQGTDAVRSIEFVPVAPRQRTAEVRSESVSVGNGATEISIEVARRYRVGVGSDFEPRLLAKIIRTLELLA